MSVNNVSQNWCDAWQECNAESFDISQESRAECVKDGIDELGDLLQGRSEDCGSAALTYFDCALPGVVCGNDDSSCLEEAEAATTLPAQKRPASETRVSRLWASITNSRRQRSLPKLQQKPKAREGKTQGTRDPGIADG